MKTTNAVLYRDMTDEQRAIFDDGMRTMAAHLALGWHDYRNLPTIRDFLNQAREIADTFASENE